MGRMLQIMLRMRFVQRFVLSLRVRVRKAMMSGTRSRAARTSSSSGVIASPSSSPFMIWVSMPGSAKASSAPARPTTSLISQRTEIFILTSISSVFDHPLLQLDGSRMLITQDCVEAVLRLAMGNQ
jgi:hypothetical protein